VNYPDSVRYLYALGNESKTMKLGLDRIRTLLEALGNPQDRLRIVHVAGTNGKGSTCAMIAAGLQAAGHRTGLYTSPHLVEPTERVRVDGEPVTHEEFARAFDHVHTLAEQLVARGALDAHPSYFETVTAMAFHLFVAHRVDWLVCEVGLGGRLDATNVVKPALTVITQIDFDHMQYLGDTLTAIAGEKAGILKPGIPAVISRQAAEAGAAIRQRAAAVGAPLIETADWALSGVRLDAFSCAYEARHGAGRIDVRCPLAGEHQVENSLTAALALRALGVVTDGLSRASWPGRLETLQRDPWVVLDGAHNVAGVRRLREYVDRYFSGAPATLIFGVMADKNVAEMAGILFPAFDRVIATAPQFERALPPDQIRAAGPAAPPVETAPHLEAAWALYQNRRPHQRLMIAGSLFLVGEARRLLRAPAAPMR
jgi:dihydrofolate synthase/folylpolyglutamate synthase